MLLEEAKTYGADDLHVGLSAEFEKEITEADVLAFAQQSGDHNPLHVDAEYAEQSTFQGRIVHGAYQVGLASALIGMHLPGRDVLLGSVNARFPSPLYFPARVKVRGELTAWNRQKLSGQVKVAVVDRHGGVPTADVLLGFTLRESRRVAEPAALPLPPTNNHSDRPIVLVTGAAGGVGTAIVADLAHDFHVLSVVNRHPLDERLADLSHVQMLEADLCQPNWENQVRELVHHRPLYGIIHAAWPGSPHGGLLDAQDDVIAHQLAFGTTCTIRLARLLHALVGPDGGRLVVLGSMIGTQRPQVSRAAYSLGKAALEHTVRLLAPELARKSITINVVSPSFIPTGMNRTSNERQLKLELAQVPLGRLCTSSDVAQTVRHLLTPAAAFITGQFIGLAGGQL
jgi:NAD(P)-dependent dehydrogenase (short-subunit alcohol dehydrogenase family)/acyl dehydratase